MLTIVIASDQPDMQDAGQLLTQTVQVVGKPDIVLVADTSDRLVILHCLEPDGDGCFSEKRKLKTSRRPPLKGECVFVETQNCNLIGDVFLRRFYDEFQPEAGQRFRLLRLTCYQSDGGRVQASTLREKCSVR